MLFAGKGTQRFLLKRYIGYSEKRQGSGPPGPPFVYFMSIFSLILISLSFIFFQDCRNVAVCGAYFSSYYTRTGALCGILHTGGYMPNFAHTVVTMTTMADRLLRLYPIFFDWAVNYEGCAHQYLEVYIHCSKG